MSDNQTDTDQEKLRAFEKKMHDEGAAGFADGPCPWETWDDKTGVLGSKRVWEGTSRRIYPKKRTQPSLGDRVLSGLAMLSLATMVVGIAGVYFSDHQPRQVVATGVQPLPIERTPAATEDTIAGLEQLPATAAGDDTASGSGQDAGTHPVSEAPSGADSLSATDDAPDGHHPLHEAALPEIAAEFSTPAYVEVTPAVAVAESPAMDDSGSSEPVMAATAPETTPASPSTAATVSVAADTVSPPAAPEDQAATAAPQALLSATAEPVPGDAAPGATDPEPGPVAGAAPAIATATAGGMAEEPSLAPEATTETGNADGMAGTPGDTPAGEMPAAETADTPPGPDAGAAVMAATETADTPAEPDATAAAPVPAANGTDIAETTAGPEALPGTSAETAPGSEADAEAGSAGGEAATEDTVVAAAAQDAPPAPTPPAAAAAEASEPATRDGDWVVNLAAYTRESMASRMLAKFRDQGVDAEMVSVMINDQPMYRIRVAGFASSREARARIPSLEQQLDLDGVWIGKK